MSTDNTQSLPSTHFQTELTLKDNSTVNVVVSLAADNVNFYLDRQVTQEVFGPEQIVEVLIRLELLTATLNKYVSDRITEAKASLESDPQPELNLDDCVSAEAETCEASTCCGGRGADEVAPHAGLPE
jgi:hypothetical protein